MADLDVPARESVEQQAEMFRRAKRDHGIDTRYLVSKGFKKTTVEGWASGTVQMPAWAVGALSQAGMPDDLLSLIYAPYGGVYGTDVTDDDLASFDEAAVQASEYLSAWTKMRAGGRSICHVGASKLRQIGGRGAAVFSRVVRGKRA